MPRRKDLNNDFSGAQRTTLVDLMMRYITDEVVTKVTTISFPHPGFTIWDKRRFIEEMEHFLLSNGRAEFVPLPKWNPVNEVPVEFRVMRPTREDGTPWFPDDPALPPFQNPGANPARTMPDRYSYFNVCAIQHDRLLHVELYGSWYRYVITDIGGIFGNPSINPVVPLDWCWRAFLDDILYDWQSCQIVHPSLIYTMISIKTGLAADIEGASLAQGIPLIQWHLHEGPNQQWRFIPLTGEDEGYYQIESVNSGLVLDVKGGSPPSLIQWPAHSGDNQKWRLSEQLTDNGVEFQIESKLGGGWRVMHVEDESVEAGARVILAPENQGVGQSQSWLLKALIG